VLFNYLIGNTEEDHEKSLANLSVVMSEQGASLMQVVIIDT